MATAIGNPHDPTSTLIPAGKCDLVIHISDLGGSDSESKVQQMCDRIPLIFPNLRTLLAYPRGQERIEGEVVSSNSDQCWAFAYSPEHLSSGIPHVRSMQEYKTALSFSQSAEARACVLLANNEDLLSSGTVTALVNPILEEGLDLAASSYQAGPFEGMVNSAILYPLSRVISGSIVKYPLAPDVAISANAQAFLLQQPLRNAESAGHAGILWPTLELELAGFKVGQVAVGRRTQTAPSNISLEDLITDVVGSLFTGIELRASLWQKNLGRRQPAMIVPQTLNGSEHGAPDPVRLVESFKLGSSNLQEIWRLVLPPHSMLALKRLAQLSAQDFHMPDNLWVRVVYDFLLAHRSRTLSRKHLLGALTPLYLGWVASYVMDLTRHGHGGVEERIETLAAAFEADRTYLVSQWRWPDRFNP